MKWSFKKLTNVDKIIKIKFFLKNKHKSEVLKQK
jgi:hypothetical protein